ncbi:hypothetical protein ZWY2020_000228 [Hordeum vulgare]|nr:hypothetical protein ZWY2020_000228 [Hordeum vulgare]
MILRDHAGSIIFTSCRHLYSCSDILEVELLALKEGISLALQWSNLPIDIETDCLEAITMIREGAGNKSKYAFVVRETIDSMRERDSCITHSRRNCNKASQFMANFGRLHYRTAVWLRSGPKKVLEIVERDVN